MSMGGEYYESGNRFIWYEKPTLLNQKMFHLPVLGWVTVFQFALLIGVGLPGMYIGLSIGGPIAAPWPVIAAFIFAKFRPPLVGFEGRLYHILHFRMFGPKEAKTGPKPKKYAMPRLSREAAQEAEPEPMPVLEVPVTDRPWRFELDLPERPKEPQQLILKVDGVTRATPYPSSDGKVQHVLYPDEMTGELSVTVHDRADRLLGAATLVCKPAG